MDLVVRSTPAPFYIRMPPLMPKSSILICTRLNNYSPHPMLCQYGVLWWNSKRHWTFTVCQALCSANHMHNLTDSSQQPIRLKWIQMMSLWNEYGSGPTQCHPCISAGTKRGLSDSNARALPHHTYLVLLSRSIWVKWFSSGLGNQFPVFSWTVSL